MSDSLTDSLNFVTQFLPKRACEGSPTTSHGDMEECPRCQVRVDREMVHHPVFGFASMCGLKTSTAPACTACGLREKVARLEFALAETETRRAAVDKLHAETLSALGADEHDLGPDAGEATSRGGRTCGHAPGAARHVDRGRVRL